MPTTDNDEFGENVEDRAQRVCKSANAIPFEYSRDSDVLRHARKSPLRHLERLLSDTSLRVLDLKQLESIRVIGKGSFGSVRLCKYGPNKEPMALKVITKVRDPALESHTSNEIRALIHLKSLFIVELYGLLETPSQLILAENYCPGGDLFTRMQRYGAGGLQESECLLHAAQLVTCLEHVHFRGYVYRDLKPENILIDEAGYLRLADFGFAQPIGRNESDLKSVSGTPEYFAPEMITKSGYGQMVDWWALGIVIYEMLCNKTPFGEPDMALPDMYASIMDGHLVFPEHFSDQARDIIRLLLQPNSWRRGGAIDATGCSNLRCHPWFRKIRWPKVRGERIAHLPPFSPMKELKSDFDTTHFDEYDESDIRPRMPDGNFVRHAEFAMSKSYSMDTDPWLSSEFKVRNAQCRQKLQLTIPRTGAHIPHFDDFSCYSFSTSISRECAKDKITRRYLLHQQKARLNRPTSSPVLSRHSRASRSAEQKSGLLVPSQGVSKLHPMKAKKQHLEASKGTASALDSQFSLE